MSRSKRASERRAGRASAAGTVLLMVLGTVLAGGLVGCAHRPRAAVAATISAADVARLRRPPQAGMAALYRLRVPSSGGLRLTVTTAGDEVRVAIAEPFGSTLSLSAWRDGAVTAFDLQRGCRLAASDAAAALGVPALPIARVARLLAGRLPAVPADDVEAIGDGEVVVRGGDGDCRVTLAAEPWRVTAVAAGDGSERSPRWRLELSDHSGSVPGAVGVTTADGRWAELQLARLEWGTAALPELPAGLPPCAEVER